MENRSVKTSPSNEATLSFHTDTWPLCVVHSARGRVEIQDIRALLAWTRRQAEKEERFAVLFDLTDCLGVSQASLRLLGDTSSEVQEIQRASCVSIAYAAERLVVRMAVRASLMLSPDVVPFKTFRLRTEAETWLREQILKDKGLHLPV